MRSRNWRTRGLRALLDLLGRAHGQDVAAIDQNDAVGDQEGAGQFVRHDDDAHGVCLLEVQDEIVDAGGHDRVEPRRRLIEEQDLRVHRQRAGDGGALLHAAAQLRGAEAFETAEAHLLQLDPHHDFDGGWRQVGVLEQRQRDVFAHCHGTDQRAALKREADLLADGIQLARRGARQIDALDQHFAGSGFSRPTSVRSSVLFPDPEPPRMTTVSPCKPRNRCRAALRDRHNSRAGRGWR